MKLSKCLITNKIIPQEFICNGHPLPEKLGGKLTVKADRRIDNVVGSRFDSELIKFINQAKNKMSCKIHIPGAIDGSIDGTIERIDNKISVHANLGDCTERMFSYMQHNLNSVSGDIYIKLIDPRKVFLSLIHSTLLHMARANQNKCKNRYFYQKILQKGLYDIESINDDDWSAVNLRCEFVKSDFIKVNREKLIKATQRDIIAFNYKNIIFGVSSLNSTFEKYYHGKIKNILVLDK